MKREGCRELDFFSIKRREQNSKKEQRHTKGRPHLKLPSPPSFSPKKSHERDIQENE
jgi:hypothetical protein